MISQFHVQKYTQTILGLQVILVFKVDTLFTLHVACKRVCWMDMVRCIHNCGTFSSYSVHVHTGFCFTEIGHSRFFRMTPKPRKADFRLH